MPSSRLTGSASLALLFLSTCYSLPALARKHQQKKPPAPAIVERMDERERAIHALSRLTFGPRPGDVDRVLAVGVDNWIAEQLNPDKIDDSALAARLEPYRTLRMTAAEMVENFPPPPILKLVADGKMAMPSDPAAEGGVRGRDGAANQRQTEKSNSAKNEKAAQNADLLEMSPDDMTAEMRNNGRRRGSTLDRVRWT